MSQTEIVRAWKDARYRSRLSAAQLAQLPSHPSGLVELPETSFGGSDPTINCSLVCTTAMTCGCPLTYRCPTSDPYCS